MASASAPPLELLPGYTQTTTAQVVCAGCFLKHPEFFCPKCCQPYCGQCGRSHEERKSDSSHILVVWEAARAAAAHKSTADRLIGVDPACVEMVFDCVRSLGFQRFDVQTVLRARAGSSVDAIVAEMLTRGPGMMPDYHTQRDNPSAVGRSLTDEADLVLASQLAAEDAAADRKRRLAEEADEAAARALAASFASEGSAVDSSCLEDEAIAKQLAREAEEVELQRLRAEEDDRAAAEALQVSFLQDPPSDSATSKFKCVVCSFDEEPDIELDACMFLDCGHVACFDCLKGQAKAEFEEQNRIPCCPAVDDDGRCTHMLTEQEMEAVYADDLRADVRDNISKSYLRRALNGMKAVGCPRPSCSNSLLPMTPGVPEKCSCPCGMEYCSQCQEPFHYDVGCDQASAHAAAWDLWLREGHEQYLRHKAEQDEAFAEQLRAFNGKKTAFNKELEEAMERRRTMEQDEAWMARNCRRCPHCGRAVNKIEGCDSMRCGQDYHGGNMQPGCGRNFSWSRAKPYNSDGNRTTESAVATLPTFTEEEPEQEVEDVLIGHSDGEAIKLRCDLCSEDCGELALQCINCPGMHTVCIMCMPALTQGCHDGTHVFRILGKWRVEE